MWLATVTLLLLAGQVCANKQKYHLALTTNKVPISQSSVVGKRTTRTTVECATVCLQSSDRCMAFQFDESQHTCYPMTCVNIDVLDDTSGDSSVYINGEVSTLLARGKPTEMSSEYRSIFGSEKAVDGIYLASEHGLGEGNSLAHSQPETNPWWRVDLGDVHCVWSVKILNRAEFNKWTRAVNASVTVSTSEEDVNDDINNLCSYYPGILNQYYTTITCTSPMAGRFVQIKLMTKTTLEFYEVEVRGF